MLDKRTDELVSPSYLFHSKFGRSHQREAVPVGWYSCDVLSLTGRGIFDAGLKRAIAVAQHNPRRVWHRSRQIENSIAVEVAVM